VIPASTPILRVEGVRKAFGPVPVLHGIDLEIRGGEVLALLGENGAGKSTLLNIMGGVLHPDAGAILLDGVPRRWSAPREARDAGIAFVHQELSAIRSLSVAENIFLGDYRARHGFVDRVAMSREARRLLDAVGASHIRPGANMGRLGNADQQVVEIAKAQARPLKLLILDEPTSSLTPHEVEGLFRVMRRLRASGVALVFISHRLDEVFALADRIVVLRDGRLVSDRNAASATRDSVIADMTGRVGFFGSRRQATPLGDIALRVEALRYQMLGPLSFSVRAGEVLGIFGLVGAGRTELLEVLAGVRNAEAGRAVLPDGGGLPRTPREAWARGVAILPEDRKQAGIAGHLSVLENTRLAVRRRGPAWLSAEAERRASAPLLRRLGVRAAGLSQPVGRLSGGNQQKVVLARCLSASPRLLLLDEPTRGIDVRTKADLYGLIGELAESGMAVVFASSELPEVLALATTVLVLAHGQQTLLRPNEDLGEAEVLAAAFNERPPASRAAGAS
jgi:ribose transport system ATP-binding protein